MIPKNDMLTVVLQWNGDEELLTCWLEQLPLQDIDPSYYDILILTGNPAVEGIPNLNFPTKYPEIRLMKLKQDDHINQILQQNIEGKYIKASIYHQMPYNLFSSSCKLPLAHDLESRSYNTLFLDYISKPKARWGYKRPPHPQIQEILNRGRQNYKDLLTQFLQFKKTFSAIPGPAPYKDAPPPYWDNGWLVRFDAVSLYCLLGLYNPGIYMEVGSGFSTAFARRSITDLNLATKIISVDPHPRAEVDAICDTVIRSRVEDVDLSIFDQLESGDILFIDNSHRILQNSDATVTFLDIFPRLKPGVLVHVHDIFWPYDYPVEWMTRFYSEQYLLAAYILAESPRYVPFFPVYFISEDEELSNLSFKLFDRKIGGGSFWLKIGETINNGQTESAELNDTMHNKSPLTEEHSINISKDVSRDDISNDRNALSICLKGEELFVNGDIDGAGILFEKAISIDPDLARAYNNAGTVYWKKGDNQKAIETFKITLSKDKGNVDSILNLGLLLEESGNVSEAKELYSQFIQNESSHSEVLKRYQKLL